MVSERVRLGLVTAVVLPLLGVPVSQAAVAATPSTPQPHGHVVLVGGALEENAAAIFDTIVSLADPDGAGPRKARIAIDTAGSQPAESRRQAENPARDNAAANGIYYSRIFRSYGALTYRVPIDVEHNYRGDPYVPSNAASEAVAAHVQASTGVFFGGGDQMRYVLTLLRCEARPHDAFRDCHDTPVLGAVRRILDHGGVVSGTSAGLTIQQGSGMVTGGDPYRAWRDGSYPGYFPNAAQLGYIPYGGFGIVSETMLDSHFATRGRQARMIRLALNTGHRLVFGVDETTALVVDDTSKEASVIGRRGVSVVDLSHARGTGHTVEGVRWSYLRAGDSLNLRSGRVEPRGHATPVERTGPGPRPSRDVWDSYRGPSDGYALRDLAVALATSVARQAIGTTYEHKPTYRTALTWLRSTRGWTGAGHGVAFSGLAPRITPR